MDLGWFHMLCTPDEARRAASASSASDYLLRLRADTILDHTRLTRVFLHRRRAAGAAWSLTGAFDDSHYRAFLAHLSRKDRRQCRGISFGDVFSTNPNGRAFKTPYGPLVSLCHSMTYFCKFAHLALLDFGEEHVPLVVRQSALLIATRVMMKFEAMDFWVDPRGTVPRSVAAAISAPVPYQLEWIAGHEFSHFLLGHLSSDGDVEHRMMPVHGSESNHQPPQKIFTRSQSEELDADRESLLRPKYEAARRLRMRNAALLWLAAVQLYETVNDIISPRVGWMPLSHPSPKERFDALLEALPPTSEQDRDSWKQLQDCVLVYQDFLRNYLLLHMDDYEMYGSVYLGPPNTEWRGPELLDRVDY